MRKLNKKWIFLILIVALTIGLSIFANLREKERRLLEQQRTFERLQFEAMQSQVHGDAFLKQMEEREKQRQKFFERELLKEEIKSELKPGLLERERLKDEIKAELKSEILELKSEILKLKSELKHGL